MIIVTNQRQEAGGIECHQRSSPRVFLSVDQPHERFGEDRDEQAVAAQQRQASRDAALSCAGRGPPPAACERAKWMGSTALMA